MLLERGYMMHRPIQIKDLELSFPHKTCFEKFNCQIIYGNRIAIIGRNGSGKSTLLKMIAGLYKSYDSHIKHESDTTIGYVPQLINDHLNLSGSERLNSAVTRALSLDPNVLLLDEPTNHLDRRNRKSLMRLLQNYPGTLIVASHDKELLRHCIDTLWHIDDGRIRIFTGAYDDYIHDIHSRRASIEQEIVQLERQKKDMHYALMQEQKRAAKSKAKGKKSIQQRKWPTIVSTTKAGRAQGTSGRKKSIIERKKQALTNQLLDLRLSQIIVPKFSLSSASTGEQVILSIIDGSIGYTEQVPLLEQINLSINSRDRISIQGDNASGKSTLIKAILNNNSIIKLGKWYAPKASDIGYLDQHYATLDAEKTVLETITTLVPTWPHSEVRNHLSDFLFRKNEEVNNNVAQLSGGEKARLSLAQIAACTPKLLILDEITNNLDLETKEHVAQILKVYPGAMIVVSHDTDFLEEIRVDHHLKINEGVLSG